MIDSPIITLHLDHYVLSVLLYFCRDTHTDLIRQAGQRQSSGISDSAKSGTSPPTVQAGEEVNLVWVGHFYLLPAKYLADRMCCQPVNNHGSETKSNAKAFLWHSYTADPDDDLFSTTPLVELAYGNCFDGGR